MNQIHILCFELATGEEGRLEMSDQTQLQYRHLEKMNEDYSRHLKDLATDN